MWQPIVILLVQALAVQGNLFSKTKRPGNDAEALCSGKKIELTTFTQLRELHARVKTTTTPACSELIKEALGELELLVGEGSADLCSVSSINKLRAFYLKYLDSSEDAATEHERLPRSLRKFVLAYGLQMSNLCKRRMVNILTDEGRTLLEPSDFAQLEEIVGERGPVAQVLGSIGQPDEVFLPGDLAPLMRKHGLASDKLFMQTTTGEFIKNLQTVCRRRFKPIYGPLMVPLVQLSNLGFNYKDDPLKCKLKCPAVLSEVGQWSRIVFMCESLLSIHIVQDPEDKQLAEGTGSNLVRIITAEEAAAIESHRHENVHHDKQQEALEAEIEQDEDETRTCPFATCEPIKLGDVIYDKLDKKLKNAIKTFKTSRSELETIKRRLVSRGFAIVKQELKKGNFGLLFSTAYKGMLQKMKKGSKQAEKPTERMVKMLDEVVEGKPLDGAVSYDVAFSVNGTTLFLTLFAIGMTLLIIWAVVMHVG